MSQIVSVVDKGSVRVQASSPLQFVPWDVSCEEGLTDKVGGNVLAFAVQKVGEIVDLAKAVPFIAAGKQVRNIEARLYGVAIVWEARATFLLRSDERV